MAEAALTLEPTWAVSTFRAMGSRCRIVAPTSHEVDRGRATVERLEQSWTRFRPDSELNWLNAGAGRLCLVSDDLHAVLTVAERAHRISKGTFDIRCLDAVEGVGYTRSWDEGSVDATDSTFDPDAVPTLPADDQFVLFDEPPAVIVPSGHRLDLGGIGKGFAADVVADELIAAGAACVQVELGGDVRVAGSGWTDGGWTVEIEHPHDPDRVVATVDIDEGAVATSSVLKRRWRNHGVVSHHLIDVRTMQSADTDLVAVTAIADRAWRAEVAAKCALIAGATDAADVVDSFGAGALLFGADGTIVEVNR